MGAGSGGGGRGLFRVRGRLGQELTAQAGSKGRVGAPSPSIRAVSDLFLPLATVSESHRQLRA